MFYNPYRLPILFGIYKTDKIKLYEHYEHNRNLLIVVNSRYPQISTQRDMYYMTQRFAERIHAGIADEMKPEQTVMSENMERMRTHYHNRIIATKIVEFLDEEERK